MTYYMLQNHHGDKIGTRVYFDLKLARGVAKRTAGKWRKNNDLRGMGIKIVQNDGSLYLKTIEWVQS